MAASNFDSLFFDSTSGVGKDAFGFSLDVTDGDVTVTETYPARKRPCPGPRNVSASVSLPAFRPPLRATPTTGTPAMSTGTPAMSTGTPAMSTGTPAIPQLPCHSQQKACSPRWRGSIGSQQPANQRQRSPQIGIVAPSQQVYANSSQRGAAFQPPNSRHGDRPHHMTAVTQTPRRQMIRPSSSSQDVFDFSQCGDQLQTPQLLTLPGTTPGGSTHGTLHLRPLTEIPEEYRGIFKFPFFNNVQSKVFDEVFYSDRPIVLCAPTGSGKTVVFELAIIRLMLQHTSTASKVIYMAPVKALCSERFQDWTTRFGPLGLKCLELTGDTELDDYFDLQDANIIFTTPEKWDSMTRRWRDNKSLVHRVRLFLIDEVHMLNDETRGATMEAVVSRMKTVQSALTQGSGVRGEGSQGSGVRGEGSHVRFVAVSATVPNVEDIAAWLSCENQKPAFFNMDDSCRPVRLRKVVLGYPCSDNLSEFRFDLSLNYKLATVIDTYSEQKPTLVFCATRKGTQQGACTLAKDARFVLDSQHRQRLQRQANHIKDTKLRELVLGGIGYHHAGLDTQDRKIVEELFAHGELPVLLATSTLAMGVNLPAHLVIVKSSQHYVMGVYQEYSETQILQMIGRAGRPQFDTTATAVIMTRNSTKARYESLLDGTQVIESSLHRHLVEHLMAEIVLNTITDVTVALTWLKSTFLYIRVMKNPTHYGIPSGLTTDKVEHKLQEMCLKSLNMLASVDLLHLDEVCFDLKATDTGRLMARYCVAFDTMKNFHQLSGTETIGELLAVLCKSQEFSDVQLRTNEKRILNTLNKDKNRATIRFPMDGKIKTNEMKVSCLIQTQLGCLPLQDFALQQDSNKIFRASNRIARCLMEMAWQKTDFKSVLNAVILLKCLRAKLWENSRHVSRQLTGIGVALANALVNQGVCTLQKIEETNPRDLELIVNRHPPFGKQVKDAVCRLPKYQVCIDQSTAYSDHTADLTVTVDVTNRAAALQDDKAPSSHGNTNSPTCMLLIGDADNKVVFKVKLSDAQLLRGGPWSRKFTVTRASKAEELSVNYINQDWVGLDVQSTFTPVYTGLKRMSLTRGSDSSPDGESPHSACRSSSDDFIVDDVEDDPDLMLGPDRQACNHRCANKTLCLHDCCKVGVPVKKRLGMSNSVATYKKGLKHKLQYMSDTPQLKMPRDASTPSRLDLQQYTYTPRGVSAPPSRMATPTAPPVPTPRGCVPTPRGCVPTPRGCVPTPRGWEHLDLYEQRQQTAWELAEDIQIVDDQKEWFGTAREPVMFCTGNLDSEDDQYLLNASEELDPSQPTTTAPRHTSQWPASTAGLTDPSWLDEDSLPDLEPPVLNRSQYMNGNPRRCPSPGYRSSCPSWRVASEVGSAGSTDPCWRPGQQKSLLPATAGLAPGGDRSCSEGLSPAPAATSQSWRPGKQGSVGQPPRSSPSAGDSWRPGQRTSQTVASGSSLNEQSWMDGPSVGRNRFDFKRRAPQLLGRPTAGQTSQSYGTQSQRLPTAGQTSQSYGTQSQRLPTAGQTSQSYGTQSCAPGPRKPLLPFGAIIQIEDSDTDDDFDIPATVNTMPAQRVASTTSGRCFQDHKVNQGQKVTTRKPSTAAVPASSRLSTIVEKFNPDEFDDLETGSVQGIPSTRERLGIPGCHGNASVPKRGILPAKETFSSRCDDNEISDADLCSMDLASYLPQPLHEDATPHTAKPHPMEPCLNPREPCPTPREPHPMESQPLPMEPRLNPREPHPMKCHPNPQAYPTKPHPIEPLPLPTDPTCREKTSTAPTSRSSIFIGSSSSRETEDALEAQDDIFAGIF